MSYYLRQLLLTALVLGLHVVLGSVLPRYEAGSLLFWILMGGTVFLSGKTMLSFYIVNGSLHKSPISFANAVSSSLIIKLLLSIGFVLLVALNTDVSQMAFVGVYLSTYILFTGFEIHELLNNLRRNSKNAPPKH